MAELHDVITILGIIDAISIPAMGTIIADSREDVCDAIVIEVERLYQTYLSNEELVPTEAMFTTVYARFLG
ncbi:hypothetical protein [Radiobacillus sp. PE A8.2]|uniref:hypothetical protein n=1 Tax=Radiobacillus sp. PE A8.2 TaxID=3380349 RepID=UPI00388E4BC0